MQLTKKIIILLLVTLTFSSVSAYALTPEEIGELRIQYKDEILKKSINECSQTMIRALDLEQAAFFQFLKENFENKSSNTSLTNIAISRYADHKRRLEDLLALLLPGGVESSNLYADEVAAYTNCAKVTNIYTLAAKEEMIRHIKKTTAQKKTIIMVEKYQAINDQLRELNVDIAKLYSLFMTFKEKLPGFLQNCVQ